MHQGNRLTQSVKIPRIKIPTFDGTYHNWTSFYDAFTVLVDRDENIPLIEKMHHLRSCLGEDALRLISNIPVCEKNYELAWKVLRDRYHNKRAITNACLKSLFNQQPIQSASAIKIKSLVDVTRENLQCIETLDIPINEWDPMIVFIIQSKLDKDTLREWETYIKGTKSIPRVSEMFEFLETRFRILEASDEVQKQSNSKVLSHIRTNEKRKDECHVCKAEHWTLQCPKFDAWTSSERNKFVRDHELCRKCLHPHKNPCRSKIKCRICKSDEHTTKLHEDVAIAAGSLSTYSAAAIDKQSNSKLLATAIIKLKDEFGAQHLLRAFIDEGSEGAIVTEHAAQLLSLPRKREHMEFTGVDNASLGNAKTSVRLQVESVINSKFKLSFNAFVNKSIISKKVHDENEAKKWNHLNGLQLADPEYLTANKVDLLLGVDIAAIIRCDGFKKGKPHEPIAQNSEFGWLVFGAISSKKDFNIRIHSV